LFYSSQTLFRVRFVRESLYSSWVRLFMTGVK
jgi:hypothetical protein